MEDAQTEIDRVKEEQESSDDDAVMRRAFGLIKKRDGADVNGQQGILEAQGAGAAEA